MTSEGGALCAWCGGAASPIATRLAECGRCGAATTWPPPDARELQADYEGWYRPASGRFSAGGDILLHLSRGGLARRLDRVAAPGPVLDVGCGDGALLDGLGDRGREAVGLERVAARSDVRACEITDFAERPGEWAAIVFWHSLEHLWQPAAALDRACELLAPGGLLAIALPNRSSWQASIFGKRWFALDLPRHLVHLPAATLVDRLIARGLEIERVSYWRGGQVTFGWLHGLVGTLPGHPNLYDAIRQAPARSRPMTTRQRAWALAAGTALSPLAFVLAVIEVAAKSGGTVYVEARRQ
jgi:SAM-dependent methyltransferase